MDAPRRIRVKYFVQEPTAVSLPAFTPIFHRWIQEEQVDGLLLDVADYAHVPDGPGILLIGHEADYGLDLGGGRPGLVYDRKRDWETDSLSARLRTVFQHALYGCWLLEQDDTLGGHIRFAAGEAELSFVDRLRTPNQQDVYDALVGDVRSVLDELYGPDGYSVAQSSADERRVLTIHIRATAAPALSTLVGRLQPKPIASVGANGAMANGRN